MRECPSSAEAGPPVSEETWERALAAVYDACAAKVLLYGRALGLSHVESEDILHDVFASMLGRSIALEKPENYVIRAFRNRALNYRRGWWRRLTRELESKSWFEPTEPASLQEEMAMRCLAELPVEQREAIVLKLWQEMTFEEIAALQEVSPNTAAGRFRYGLQKLKNCLTSSPLEMEDQHENTRKSRIHHGTINLTAAPAAAVLSP